MPSCRILKPVFLKQNILHNLKLLYTHLASWLFKGSVFWALAKDQELDTSDLPADCVLLGSTPRCGLIPAHSRTGAREDPRKPMWTSANTVQPMLTVSAVTFTCPVQVCKTLLETDQSTILRRAMFSRLDFVLNYGAFMGFLKSFIMEYFNRMK